jgi:YHS domain-containing protein
VNNHPAILNLTFKESKAMKLINSIKVLAATAGLLIATATLAGVDTETDENSVILAGHDAVAYFTQNAAVEGDARISATYNDAIYHFSSKKNRDLFVANPAKYAPQFGGFCAYGTTFGKKFEIDGKAFEVVDGKLYVNKNLKVYETWSKDKSGNITAANEKWPGIENVAASDL